MANKWTAAELPDQRGKTYLITGANSGLGLVMAREVARQHATVIMACRSLRKGQAAIDTIRLDVPDAQLRLMALDLADLSSVRAFADDLVRQATVIDVLCNNAGVMAIPYRQTVDGFEMQLGTNHLGHFALTGLLLDCLLAAPSARVVTVSSGAHKMGKMDFGDLNWEEGYKKWPAYGRSKLANLLFTQELQRRFDAAGVNAIAVAAHPGYAATNLQMAGPQMENSTIGETVSSFFNHLFAQSAEQGVLPQLYAATMPDVQGGAYYGPDGFMEMRGYPQQTTPNEAAQNEADAAKLWAISEKLTGVTYATLDRAYV